MGKLVEFNTAKLAKEKGFDLDVYDAFVDEMPYRCPLTEQFNRIDFPLKAISRPTQSELQAWLREKHRVHVSANPWRDDMHDAYKEEIPEEGFQILYEGNVVDVNDDWNTFSDFSYYHSHEECLEDVLIEGLKLLKDKKDELDFSQLTDVDFNDVDHNDAPDYVDAYVSRALYKGFPATQDEIDVINENSEFVHDSLFNQLN